MRLQVKGRNVEITESIRDYAEAKLAKIDRQLAIDTRVELELAEEKHSAQHVAEGAVFTKGPTLRAHESAPDIRTSIDRLVDNLERQVTRYREKRRFEPRRRTAHHGI
jgi:putative sigma-54 modulation protein